MKISNPDFSIFTCTTSMKLYMFMKNNVFISMKSFIDLLLKINKKYAF